jgi:hypothetical protein
MWLTTVSTGSVAANQTAFAILDAAAITEEGHDIASAQTVFRSPPGI